MVQPPWCDVVEPDPNVPRECPDHPAPTRSNRNAEEHRNALYSIYTPFMGAVRLAEYVCTHSFSIFFTEEDPDFVPEDIE